MEKGRSVFMYYIEESPVIVPDFNDTTCESADYHVFLEVVKKHSQDGEITPETWAEAAQSRGWIVERAGNRKLWSARQRASAREYENHSGLEALNEPEIIDEENAESEDRSEPHT